MSAFHDMDYIYPVKITIREAEGKQANRFYMVITVGMIDIEDKIKEALTNTRVHPKMGESLPAGGASFNVSVPQLISNFNSEEGIILKNLPNGLLNDSQQQIKQKIIEADIQRELAIAAEKLEKTIKTSSVQLDYVQESLDNNRAAIKEQATEQEREEKQKDSLDDIER